MIYIDASRYSNTEKRTGVENYSFQLINELVKRHQEDITLISPRKIDLKVSQIIIPMPRFWTLLRLSLEILKDRKIDNLFVPSHVLPLICPRKTTITIHDVVFKYSPESYSLASRLYLDWAAKFAVKHATRIIVPSEATKKDLITFYKAPSSKIEVIPLGLEKQMGKVNKARTQKILGKHKLETGKYFLYIGRIEHKKNTDTLIKAYKLFRKNYPNIKLVLSGFPGHGGAEILKAAKNEKGIIRTGYVDKEAKTALLQNALCFVFPSRYEGFGIPLLEAMDAKLPIIASEIPTSREILGDSGVFFKTSDEKELTRMMEKVSTNAPFRKKNVEKYAKILQKYDWRRIAERTFEIIS